MSDRPYIICHMIMSIDGKILGRRWKTHSESKLTSKLYESTAAEIEAGSWLVGTTTMKELTGRSRALKSTKKQIPEGDFIADAEAETFAIGTDTSGALRFDEDNVGGDHAVVITTEKASKAYLTHLRDNGVSYLICGKEKINLKKAMKKLRAKFGIERLFLEGGGVINGSMLQAGLIDEISQLIIPIIDGGGADVTGFFESSGKPPATAVAALKLISQKTLEGGTQWLRYKVK